MVSWALDIVLILSLFCVHVYVCVVYVLCFVLSVFVLLFMFVGCGVVGLWFLVVVYKNLFVWIKVNIYVFCFNVCFSVSLVYGGLIYGGLVFDCWRVYEARKPWEELYLEESYLMHGITVILGTRPEIIKIQQS